MLPYNDELVVNGTLLAFEKATDYRFILLKVGLLQTNGQ
jgi:hypothetical protein